MIEKAQAVELIDNIPLNLDIAKIMVRLELHGGSKLDESSVRELADTASKVARPRALYRESFITGKTGNSVEIDGTEFVSHLLRINLDRADRVFPYIATCGKELDSLQVSGADDSLIYCLKLIKEMTLTAAVSRLQDYLSCKYALDFIFILDPGEMQAWPSDHRKLLFSLLGNVEKPIGVRLTEDNSLIPAYSRTGIFYHADIEFESCQLCSKEPCMTRRAPYNPELANKHLRQATRICGL
ncbi:MAG: hypothetical protein PHU23_03045 [Dehalococcoidales bacterium]|nr:hypothetical protein [Dehalococcoidales bacterium]